MCSMSYAQDLSISVSSELTEDSNDLDAKVYFKKYDQNDNVCAIIKVRLTNELRNPLVLEVGGLSVVDRVEKESGEVWFYVPAQVKNLSFLCKGYTAPPLIPVRLKEGTVYRITLDPDAVYEVVTNAVLSTAYLKIKLNEPDAVISLGKTRNYERLTQNIEGQSFATKLDYGTYYFRIEHPFYEPYEGSVVLNGSTPQQQITLTPAYSHLKVTSSPSGATVYVDNRRVGVTPCTLEERLPRGKISLRLDLADYHSVRESVTIEGKGSVQTVSYTLKPSFADITLTCPDKEAEIWIDQQMVGKGSWSGRLGSSFRHYVETRRAGHLGQSVEIAVVDGESKTIELKAPVALYGTLELISDPMDCTVEIDGKLLGETTPYIGQVLVGDHTITLSKSGYQKATFPVTIAHNQTTAIEKNLKKGYTVEEMYQLGENYYYGKNGYEKDYSKAVEWFRKSAEQGYAKAQNHLGVCYRFGDGVSKDYNEAVKWYRKSAEQEYVWAQFNLGVCYERGYGVSKDINEAVKWYRKSAEQGNADAQKWLKENGYSLKASAEEMYNEGEYYYFGTGDYPQDYDKAVGLYRKAAEMGHIRAQFRMGKCYEKGQGVPQDYVNAVEWYRKAAEQGYAEAQFCLGVSYYKGKGVEKNHSKAVEWYRLAAEQGYAIAQYSLGLRYAKGEGVFSDLNEAVRWLRKAARQGHKGSQDWLKVNGYTW